MNVISTFLLANLLLPKLQETASRASTIPRLVIVSSELHAFATLKARKATYIFKGLEEATKDFGGRYNDTKLLEILYGQRLAESLSASKKGRVSVNMVNPGWCISGLHPAESMSERMAQKLLARSTEEGAMLLVDAAAAEKADKRHGKYLSEATTKK